MLFIDSDVQVKLQRTTSRKLYLWNRGNLGGLRDTVSAFVHRFTSHFNVSHPVEDLWGNFRKGCIDALDTNIPSKMTSQRFNQPWITRELKKLSRRKDRAYKRYVNSKSPHHFSRYKNLKNVVHVRCRQRYHEYVNSIIMDENHKPKRLWSFIKSKRTDACGVAPLKRDGLTHSDAKVKADILNHQFTSIHR